MKRELTAWGVVFVVKMLLDFVVHGLIMAGQYEATQDIWRPDMMDLMWINWVINLVVAFCLTWIFSKGFENKGLMEGVRFGAAVGVMLSIGMGYGTYMSFAIPYSIALQWFLYGIAQYIVVGVVLAMVFQKMSPAAAASS